MRFLTEDARLVCVHPGGEVQIHARQSWVTIAQRSVLVATDPEGCDIVKCSNVVTPNVPCTKTLAVQTGYSTFIRIEGRKVCLDSVTGLTNGTLQGTILYSVARPGQTFVGGAA
jgi:hypothetical protein